MELVLAFFSICKVCFVVFKLLFNCQLVELEAFDLKLKLRLLFSVYLRLRSFSNLCLMFDFHLLDLCTMLCNHLTTLLRCLSNLLCNLRFMLLLHFYPLSLHILQ